jgi:hypothetical protein
LVPTDLSLKGSSSDALLIMLRIDKRIGIMGISISVRAGTKK